MISEFPLFVFTTFGGLAVGAYVFAALFPVGKEDERRPWLVPPFVWYCSQSDSWGS